MKREDFTLEFSGLSAFAIGHRHLIWWGTLGLVIIELTMFAMLLGAYFYLRGRVQGALPGGPMPSLYYGVLNTILLLVSVLPNLWYKRAAERINLDRVRIALLVSSLFAAAFIIIRFYEFRALKLDWTMQAYGAVLWTLLAFHTAHLFANFIDTVSLTALMLSGNIDGRSFIDVSENAFYWNFAVISWLPIFAVIYLAPRLI